MKEKGTARKEDNYSGSKLGAVSELCGGFFSLSLSLSNFAYDDLVGTCSVLKSTAKTTRRKMDDGL